MTKKLQTIMLIDDDQATNFLHKLVIKKTNCTENIHIELNGEAAINHLNTRKNENHPHPELIFLDINMPRMNGWAFLEEYHKLLEGQQGAPVIVMLTTSLNPDDVEQAKRFGEISEYRNKPMTQEMIMDVMQKHFPSYI